MPDAAIPTCPEPVAGPTDTARPASGRRCKVRRILDALAAADPAKAARVEHLLNLDPHDPHEPGWSDRALSKALDRDGHYVHNSMLSSHRTGVCICTDEDPHA